jgi:regulation of enolase protein 1 (concanavalin A-like superfamily)
MNRPFQLIASLLLSSVVTAGICRGESAAPSRIQNILFYAGISYTGSVGIAYELQYTTNLNSPDSWMTLTNVVLDTNRLFFVDLDSPQKPYGFYRLREPGPDASTPPQPSSSTLKSHANPQVDAGKRDEQVKRVALTARWDSPIDPDRDCNITSSPGLISIRVPAAAHDFAAELKRWNAPRILSPVEGDFVLETRLSGEFNPGHKSTINGRRPYHGAGLLLVQDNGNHLSLQRGAVRIGKRVRHYANFELRHDPAAAVKNFEFDVDPGDISLRLARRGNKILAMVSQDGINWRAFSPLTVDFASSIHAGVEAISSSDTALTCSFQNLALYREQQTPAGGSQ